MPKLQDDLTATSRPIDGSYSNVSVTGFAAGTLVHTQEGLKPIEDIKVGDMVLSKHESGEGERAYKRVTKTFAYEDRVVILLGAMFGDRDGERVNKHLVVTPEHPIWIKGKGWNRAEKAKMSLGGTFLEVLADIEARAMWTNHMYKSLKPNHAWIPSMNKMEAMGMGTLYDVPRNRFPGEHVYYYDEPVPFKFRMKDEHRYKTTVYNFEVEDYHSYYITKDGIWVAAENSIAKKKLVDAIKRTESKEKPKAPPYTAEKAYSIISEIVGHKWLGENSLLDQYPLNHFYQSEKKDFIHQRYKFDSAEFENSHVFIKTATKAPDTILFMGFFSALPKDFFPSSELIKICSEKVGFDFIFFMSESHTRGADFFSLIEDLGSYQAREKSRKKAQLIKPEELPWFGMKDLSAIKPAIKELFSYSLELAEKCKTVEGWNWLFNSSDADALRLYTGNRHNYSDTEPILSRQIPSLYLAKKVHSPDFEELVKLYKETWKSPEILKKYKKINIDPNVIISVWVEELNKL